MEKSFFLLICKIRLIIVQREVLLAQENDEHTNDRMFNIIHLPDPHFTPEKKYIIRKVS